MLKRIRLDDPRPVEQIREHYEIEKELADRLRHSNREDRQYLYGRVYDELFRRVPRHSQLTRKVDPQARAKAVAQQMGLLRHFLEPEKIFLEVGPGDCSLSFEVTRFVRYVYAVDVSEEIAQNLTRPENFALIISDGCSIPVPANTVQVAYSQQLMEHLHPEDAFDQLRNLHTALSPGGIYICFTPNRISGPHDISKYFDDVATGFHLKEYTTTELASLLGRVGFTRVRVPLQIKSRVVLLPIAPVTWLEWLLERLPRAWARQIARRLPARKLLGKVLATKS